MAKISQQNVRRRQLFCLQGHFAVRSKPFWRPSDLTHFVHNCFGKARLALNKMASNLEGYICESTA